LTSGETYSGSAASKFEEAQAFEFLRAVGE